MCMATCELNLFICFFKKRKSYSRADSVKGSMSVVETLAKWKENQT